jgi:acid stress chaperone HdeB
VVASIGAAFITTNSRTILTMATRAGSVACRELPRNRSSALSRTQLVKLAGVVLVAAIAVVVPANAQVIDLSKIRCKEFIEFPKETMSYLTMWIDGYLTDEEDPRVVDLEKMKAKTEKLGLYCAQNPRMSVLTAAEDVMAK